MGRRGVFDRLRRTGRQVSGEATGVRPQGLDPVAAANALTGSWARTHRDGNVVFSGAGCWVLLALLASAAHGRARSELESAVGLPAERALEGAVSLLDMLDEMEAAHAALGLWSSAVLDPEWAGKLPQGVAGDLTGDPDADQRRIDAWVAEATADELNGLPISLSPDGVLVLASALTVRTAWVVPFDSGSPPGQGPWAARPATWLASSSRNLGALRVAETDLGAMTLLRVPGQEGIDVHLVRAGEAADPGAVLAASIGVLDRPDLLSGEDLPDGYEAPGLRVTRATSTDPADLLFVDVPAFVVRASHDLLHHEEVFGLAAASDSSSGHFPGMSAAPLAVGQAAQAATAEFSMTGFRAAAATAVEMLVGSARSDPSASYEVRHISVVFDEPFGFVATHAATSLVLAAGWIDDPG